MALLLALLLALRLALLLVGFIQEPNFKALTFPKYQDSAFELVMGETNITLELVDLKKQKKAAKAARKLEKAANKQ